MLQGFDLDDTVWIPTAKALAMFNRESLMEIDVLYEEGSSADEVASQIRKFEQRSLKKNVEKPKLFAPTSELKTRTPLRRPPKPSSPPPRPRSDGSADSAETGDGFCFLRVKHCYP